MEVIGLFREMAQRPNPATLGIHDLVGKLDHKTSDRIVQYLKLGTTVFDIMGNEPDYFDGHGGIPGAASLISDGYWIWRFDLEYYLKKYKIGLNQNFIKHVLNGHMPEKEESEIVGCVDIIRHAYYNEEKKFELL